MNENSQHERILGYSVQSPRCDFERPMGAVWDPNERDCSDDLQPVRRRGRLACQVPV
jgi:hypothetical protein